MRLHIGKASNSLKLADYLEQEQEEPSSDVWSAAILGSNGTYEVSYCPLKARLLTLQCVNYANVVTTVTERACCLQVTTDAIVSYS